MDIVLNPVKCLKGKLSLPGDKSISHRCLILGAIAKGKSVLKNLSFSRDCLSTLNCLEQLGAKFHRKEDRVEIEGKGIYGLKEATDILNVHNSGTTIRLLAGLLAGLPFFSVLSGDQSLLVRPMDRITIPLQKMGAFILGRKEGKYAPLAIYGRKLSPIDYTLPIASAQVKSALLLAGLYARGRTKITELLPTRDHTERLMFQMEANISMQGKDIFIEGNTNSNLKGIECQIPGDFSSASFFIIAATLLQGSLLFLEDVGINPRRTGLLKILKRMGVDIAMENKKVINMEPRASLIIKSSKLKATIVKPEEIPSVIDEIPVLAIAASQAVGRTEIRGAKELRVKESDRIHTICSELKKMGVKIEEHSDGFTIEGPSLLQGADVDSHNDHRLAMALAIAGLIARNSTTIKKAECVDISFPQFWKMLKEVAI